VSLEAHEDRDIGQDGITNQESTGPSSIRELASVVYALSHESTAPNSRRVSFDQSTLNSYPESSKPSSGPSERYFGEGIIVNQASGDSIASYTHDYNNRYSDTAFQTDSHPHVSSHEDYYGWECLRYSFNSS
jgi:hypothetical protein